MAGLPSEKIEVAVITVKDQSDIIYLSIDCIYECDDD
jgi:hypothetical protein